MAKMPIPALKALLAAEKADAMAGVQSSKLSADRTDATNYYLGDMQKDMPAIEGRSQAVSTDVADTIEGLMPSLMEIFAGSDEVVRFSPVGPEDVQAAEQETDYVNHVFMQQNPGWLVLYSFIKDALLSKNGFVKVWWETREEEQEETYFDLTEDEYALIVANPEIEITAHTEFDDPNYAAQPAPPPAPGMEGAPPDPDAPSPKLHDVTAVTKKTYECAKVLGVPPEEFGIARNTRTIKDATYCFHEVLKTEDELIQQGYDAKQIRNLPSYTALTSTETLARDTVNESVGKAGDEGLNEAARLIMVTEHYVRMDYDDTGKAKLYKVTTGGTGQADILQKNGKDDIEPIDDIPFAAMTPVPITHRFWGRSIADLVMDIQRIKTALLRSLLDNAYMANNPRVEVAESYASDATLDDLLVSRPGGIVRTKQPGGLNWQTVPNISAGIYPALEYFDARLEQRSGVSRQGQGLDANALQNQSATAVNQAFSAAQARMKLIARIFAETGIRDLFSLLHGTIRRHGSKAQTVRLRNQWVSVDPRDWKARNDMTVNVGLGSGGKAERMAHLMAFSGLQEKALLGGLTNVVTAENAYNTLKEIAKVLELKDTERFVTDPATQPAPQAPPDPKLLAIQAQTSLQQQKQQTDAAHQQAKFQADSALEQQKFEHEKQLGLMDMAMKGEAHRQNMAMTVAKAATSGGGTEEGGGGGQINAVLPLILDHLSKMNGPKRVVRDHTGQVVGVEPVQ